VEGGLLRRGGREPVFECSGSHVTGELKLRAASLDCLLRFRDCTFERPPDVREARLLGLAFVECSLPGLKARNLRCKHDLLIVRSEVSAEPDRADEPVTSVALTSWKDPGVPQAAVVLTDAVVDGSVVLTRSHVGAVKGRAIQADRAQVSGALLGYRMRVDGEMRLPGLRTGGNVNLSGSGLSNRYGIALDATGAHIGGSLLCATDYGRRDRKEPARAFEVEGLLSLPNSRIEGNFALSGSSITVEPGVKVAVEAWQRAKETRDPSVDPWPAIVGDRMVIDGNLECDHGFTADGTLRFVNAVIGGAVRLANARLEVAKREQKPHYDRALHLDGSEISGDLQAAGLKATGQLRLCDVTIGGNVLASDAELTHAGRDVLAARRARVAGNFEMPVATVSGTVQLAAMDVGGTIDLRGARLGSPAERNHRSYSLDLRAVITDGAGNTKISNLPTRVVDNTGPVVSITAPTEDTVVTGSVTVTVSRSSPRSSVTSSRSPGSPS
jgi:cytoskeletal protein CcmA (bactofilin family)